MFEEKKVQSDLEYLLREGKNWIERIIEKSSLITEQEISDDLFYQVRALKGGSIFSVLVREDKETLADLSTSDFPKIIIPDGRRALVDNLCVWAERTHGLGRAKGLVGGLPVYGFDFRPYQLREDGSIKTQIHAPHLNALFFLNDEGKLCFSSSFSSESRSCYLVYRWTVDREGGVIDEKVNIDLGLIGGEMVFIAADEGIFRCHHQVRKPMPGKTTQFNDFTREELKTVLDPLNLGKIDFLFK